MRKYAKPIENKYKIWSIREKPKSSEKAAEERHWLDFLQKTFSYVEKEQAGVKVEKEQAVVKKENANEDTSKINSGKDKNLGNNKEGRANVNNEEGKTIDNNEKGEKSGKTEDENEKEGEKNNAIDGNFIEFPDVWYEKVEHEYNKMIDKKQTYKEKYGDLKNNLIAIIQAFDNEPYNYTDNDTFVNKVKDVYRKYNLLKHDKKYDLYKKYNIFTEMQVFNADTMKKNEKYYLWSGEDDNYFSFSQLTIDACSNVLNNVVGTYSVIYTVSAPCGNVASATRIVNVVDTTAPVITITGDNPATVELGESYRE